MSKTRFPQVQQRLVKARSWLDGKAAYYTFSADSSVNLREEPTGYEQTQHLKKEIDDYFGFRLDYFPFFEQHAPSIWPWNWYFFSDINDDMIERKFPRDADVRTFITAYRMAVQKNQWRNIRKKRTLQLFVTFLALLPALALGVWSDVTFGFLGSTGIEGDGQTLLLLGGITLIFIMISYWIAKFFLSNTTTLLNATFESSARDLSSKVQNRMNMLAKNQKTFQNHVLSAQTDTDDIENVEWTFRAKWWMQLSMWTPKRIEYIEKFLQSEMQRLRMYRRLTNFIGNLSAFTLWGGCIALAVGTIMNQGAPLTNLDILVPLALGGIASLRFTMSSIGDKYSITNARISESIGDEEWQRFSDIGFHEELGEIVRRDKEAIRQATLKGGYGSGSSSTPPVAPS